MKTLQRIHSYTPGRQIRAKIRHCERFNIGYFGSLSHRYLLYGELIP